MDMVKSVQCHELKRKNASSAHPQGAQMNMKHCLLCSLCSDRRGRELLHRAKIRPQPESRLNGDPRLREQPGGEDGGDVLRKSQLLMIMLAKTASYNCFLERCTGLCSRCIFLCITLN